MTSYSNRFISNIEKKEKKDSTKFTTKEINNFNTKEKCYVGINGKVYNATKYLNDLQDEATPAKLNIKCGKVYDNIDEFRIFKFGDPTSSQIGVIKNYYLFKILKISFIILTIIALMAIYKYTNNVYVLIPLMITILYTLSTLLYNYTERQKPIDRRLDELENPNKYD